MACVSSSLTIRTKGGQLISTDRLFYLAAFRGGAGGTGAVDAAVWQGGLAGRGHVPFMETLIFNEL